MILQALVRRYEDTALKEDAVPFGWAIRDAVFALDLDENGGLHNLLMLEEIKEKKKIRPVFLLPQEPSGRTVAVKPAFLCDNSKYIFGLSEKSDGRDKKCFEAARTLYRRLLSDANSPAARGILRFYEQWNPNDAAGHPAIAPLLADKKTADVFLKGRFVFQINGRYAHEDTALKRLWDEVQSTPDGPQVRCLVSGKQDMLIPLHGKIALPGVSMGSVPLVSINAESFASYGKTKKDPAAQVGEKSAFAYVTALNALLLKDMKHHIRVGIDTLVYWAEGGGEQEAATFSWFAQPKEEDGSKLNDIMKKAGRGEKVTIENCDMERPFYLLCLSPNAGRISVRFFYHSTFGDLLRHNIEHYRDLEIAMSPNEKFPYLPLWLILAETTVKKSQADATPLLGGQLMHSIISGTPYPMTLYNAILSRIRAGEGVNRAKASVIKAILIRNFPNSEEREVLTVALNEQSKNKPYVLGRLFATLEQLQRAQADGKLNRTIYESYFTSASANPSSVFTKLLQLSSHHMSKLRKTKPGYAVTLDKNINAILEKLEFADSMAPFPAVLGFEDQGRFILGYYHQKAFKPIHIEEETEDEQ